MQDVKVRNSPLVRAGCGYLGLALLWIGISLGLNRLEHAGCVFELTAVIECKLLTVALIWLGRFGLFPQGRMSPRVKLWCGFWALLPAGSGMIRTGTAWTGWYLILVTADALLWAVWVTLLLDTLIAVYYRRWTMTAPRLAQLSEQWRLFWEESLKLGIWLALLLGLVFFYLVSFYRLDVYCYSRTLTVGWTTAILFFYGVAYRRLTGGIRVRLNLLEREIAGRLWGWPSETAAKLNDQYLPVLQYLLLSRYYLKSCRRPALSGWALVGHLILAGFLLGLPQLIGITLKV